MAESERGLSHFTSLNGALAWRHEAFSGAMTEMRVIKEPSECTLRDRISCNRCSSGEVTINQLNPTPQTVIYDVSECYKKVRYRKLLKKSGLCGIELEHTFEDAVIDDHNRSVYKKLMTWNYATGIGIYVSSAKSKLNPVGNGVGKSYVLHALTHRLCREGVECLYSRTTDFLMEIRFAYDDRSGVSEQLVLDRYIHVPVLLWDDLGKESFRSDWGPERFYYVIDERIRLGRPIVFSSNFDLDELEKHFGIDNYGPAIVSRIAGACKLYKLGGPDRRLSVIVASRMAGERSVFDA